MTYVRHQLFSGSKNSSSISHVSGGGLNRGVVGGTEGVCGGGGGMTKGEMFMIDGVLVDALGREVIFLNLCKIILFDFV